MNLFEVRSEVEFPNEAEVRLRVEGLEDVSAEMKV